MGGRESEQEISQSQAAAGAAMRAALRAGARGAGWASPNPLVGAALDIPGKRIRAAGHLRFGGPHAEARLLAGMDRLPRGAVLQLTLEPCSFQGKTPPCVDRILQVMPSRVVIAVLDPNPLVSGRGMARLRRAGIPVEVGPGRDEALALALPFHHFHRKGRALVRLKVASTLDSRLADLHGRSRWITGEEARRHVHRERSRADAVVAGSGTILADDPELTVRHVHGPQPSRIVVDSQLRTQPDGRVRQAWRRERGETAMNEALASRAVRIGNYREVETASGRGYLREARLILATRRGHARKRLEPYLRLGWEIWSLPGPAGGDGRGGVSLRSLARRAGREGFLSLFVEAGPGLSAGLLQEDLADELLLYQAPLVLGGPAVWPEGRYGASLGKARAYERIEDLRLGADHCVRLRRRGLLEKVRS